MGKNPIWVQKKLTALVIIFDGFGLQTNLGNTNMMVFTPGLIWGHQGYMVLKWRAEGEGSTFRYRNIIWVSCEECGATMVVS